MDEPQQLKQLVSADLPSLSKFYREMVESQGAGVLVVNYYPVGEVAQMEARFLKSSQIPRLSRQMGLPNLQTQFEQHDRETEMVVAIVIAETKGAFAVELQLPTQGDEPQTPPILSRSDASKAKSKSSDPTTQKRASSAKTTTQRQAKNKPNATATSATSKPKAAPKQTSQPSPQPDTQQEATPQPIVEPETTAKSTSKGRTTTKTSKPATKSKTAARSATATTTTKQKSQPQATPQTPAAIPEDRSDEPELETTAHKSAKRRSSTTTSTRRKSSSGGTTRRNPTTRGARGKKQS